MRRFSSLALLTFCLLASVAQAQTMFGERPAEQELRVPGQISIPRQAQAPAHAQTPVQAPVQSRQPVEQSPADQQGVFITNSYLTQDAFDRFREGLGQLIRKDEAARGQLAQQLMDLQVAQQELKSQIQTIKQAMMQISTLISAQAEAVQKVSAQSPSPLTSWWFWLFAGVDAVLLTILGLGYRHCCIKKKQPAITSDKEQ